MRNLPLIISLFLLSFVAQAQDVNKNALGIRTSNNEGGKKGYEISYQKSLSEIVRLEFDVGFTENDLFEIAALHQWVLEPAFLLENFNFFAGGGVGYGADYKKSYALLLGSLGLEYSFKFPIQLSIDTRPELLLGDKLSKKGGLDVSLGIRYKF